MNLTETSCGDHPETQKLEHPSYRSIWRRISNALGRGPEGRRGTSTLGPTVSQVEAGKLFMEYRDATPVDVRGLTVSRATLQGTMEENAEEYIVGWRYQFDMTRTNLLQVVLTDSNTKTNHRSLADDGIMEAL